MSITPGSLDYLYYNGVLDHIPYEAYEMGPISSGNQQTGLKGFPPLGSLKQSILGDSNYNSVTNTNTSDYLNSAKKGEMYGSYGNSNDYFTRSTNSVSNQSGNYSQSTQMSGASNGYGGLGGSVNDVSYANAAGYQGAGQGMTGYISGGAQGENYPKYSLFNNRGYGNQQVNYSQRDSKRSNFGNALLKMLGATGIVAGSILLFSKLKSKPAQSTTLWQNLKNWFSNNKIGSKLNPLNWFKKKSPVNNANKIGFWSKLNPLNWFKKKSPVNNANKIGFWSKLNPKNWHKKGSSNANSNHKSKFWSKLNPVNWFRKKGHNVSQSTPAKGQSGNVPSTASGQTMALVKYDSNKAKK